MSDQTKNCAILGWKKLDYNCAECHHSHADILFTFSCKGLPAGYIQSGQFVRAYHWDCLPPSLKQYQQTSEREMIAAAQEPIR